MFVSEDLNV